MVANGVVIINLESFQWLADLGHSIFRTCSFPYFTFNLPDADITKLSGVAVPDVEVKIAGTKLSHQGPLLITHWGMSGPGSIKLSAWEPEF